MDNYNGSDPCIVVMLEFVASMFVVMILCVVLESGLPFLLSAPFGMYRVYSKCKK